MTGRGQPKRRFDGKVMVVTGSAQGIGRTVAVRAAHESAHVGPGGDRASRGGVRLVPSILPPVELAADRHQQRRHDAEGSIPDGDDASAWRNGGRAADRRSDGQDNPHTVLGSFYALAALFIALIGSATASPWLLSLAVFGQHSRPRR